MKKNCSCNRMSNGNLRILIWRRSVEKGSKRIRSRIKVETNGAVGVENELTPQDIEEAVGVIIACDKDARGGSFVGKRVIEVSVKDGVHKAKY